MFLKWFLVLRWSRFFYAALFLWLFVLGRSQGSWDWVVKPFLGFSALLILQSWMARKDPEVGTKLSAVLIPLLLCYNLYKTIATYKPSLIELFPLTTRVVTRAPAHVDVRNSASATTQFFSDNCAGMLIRYATDSGDAEAASVGKEFDILSAKRRQGTFDEKRDGAHEQELFDRLTKLRNRSAELQKKINQCASGPADVTSSSPSAISLSAPGNNSKRLKIDSRKDQPDNDLSRTTTSSPKYTATDERQRRLDEFKSLVNTGIILDPIKRNVAILVTVSGPQSSVSPERSFYGHLPARCHFITGLFRREVVTHGYFDDIYDGDQEIRKLAITKSGVEALVLGRLNYTFRNSSSVATDVVCEIGFSYEVLTSSGGVAKSDSFRIVAPGFSESAALEQAIEKLAGEFSSRTLTAF
jgi:hypothetical protein